MLLHIPSTATLFVGAFLNLIGTLRIDKQV